MNVQLNKTNEDAVLRNQDQGVKWIPIDREMDGHRYCEPGIKDLDQHNDNLQLYHYPYNDPRSDAIDRPLQKALDKVTADVGIKAEYKMYNDLQNVLLDSVETDDDPKAGDIREYF